MDQGAQNPTSATPQRHRTNPIPGSITPVPGYPQKLVIYKQAASPFWWVRYYANGKIARKTTKTDDQRKAFAFAKKFYEDLLVKQRQGLAITNRTSFEACAHLYLKAQDAKLARGELTETTASNARYRLNATLIPYFAKYDVTAIQFAQADEFLHSLSTRKPKPTASTINAYLRLLRAVMSYAQQLGHVQQVPRMPVVRNRDNPRGYFTAAEYRQLWSKARSLRGKIYDLRKSQRNEKTVTRYVERGTSEWGEQVRRIDMTDDLYQLIVFMVNSFIRPTDIKNLQHKHVDLVRDDRTFLRLRLPESKAHHHPIVTMAKAVEVYERMVKARKKQGEKVSKEDYLFAAKQPNRDYALKELQRQFDVLLDVTNLRKSATGEDRSLYSLRHTCIMFRLQYGDGMDLLTLARNARTSPEMINKFYASKLQGEHNLDMLQSRRKRKQRAEARNPPQRAH